MTSIMTMHFIYLLGTSVHLLQNHIKSNRTTSMHMILYVGVELNQHFLNSSLAVTNAEVGRPFQ